MNDTIQLFEQEISPRPAQSPERLRPRQMQAFNSLTLRPENLCSAYRHMSINARGEITGRPKQIESTNKNSYENDNSN